LDSYGFRTALRVWAVIIVSLFYRTCVFSMTDLVHRSSLLYRPSW
jgi:hypothetical protein